MRPKIDLNRPAAKADRNAADRIVVDRIVVDRIVVVATVGGAIACAFHR